MLVSKIDVLNEPESINNAMSLLKVAEYKLAKYQKASADRLQAFSKLIALLSLGTESLPSQCNIFVKELHWLSAELATVQKRSNQAIEDFTRLEIAHVKTFSKMRDIDFTSESITAKRRASF